MGTTIYMATTIYIIVLFDKNLWKIIGKIQSFENCKKWDMTHQDRKCTDFCVQYD